MYRCLKYGYRYDFPASSAAANTVVSIIAALEEQELLCTVVSSTGTDMIIPPQAPLQIQYYNSVTMALQMMTIAPWRFINSP
jgi:hypothetical protein